VLRRAGRRYAGADVGRSEMTERAAVDALAILMMFMRKRPSFFPLPNVSWRMPLEPSLFSRLS
jgi:hypothetical protein